MRKAMVYLLALLLLASLALKASPTGEAGKAQQGAMTSSDKTAPSYDMKAQAIVDLQQLQKKYVELAQALPADKYNWRPEPGVRSVSELLLHVAGANYGFPTMMTGTSPAPGFKREGFEKSTTDKAAVIEQLNKSFSYAIASVQSMSNADFAKAEKKLGPDANDGDVIYLMVMHSHEHLGQTIAYARMNGVTPPWTEEAQKKAAAKGAVD
jgi:uncharacterized damage-inducible protein DinB